MPHVGTLRDFRFENSTDDIRGAALYGRDDEKLGKIKDVIFDHANGSLRYAVVDTGGWLSSKLFLVPAKRIRPRTDEEDEYVADLSKKQIENFLVYDENTLSDEKRWDAYERDYRGSAKFEETGDVLHRAGGTNILVSDGMRAEGPAPTTTTGRAVSGYRSPIHHREVGMMDTTPTGVGQNPANDRLEFVPNAIGADRGDVKDKPVIPADAESPNSVNRSIGATDVERDIDIVHHEDDRYSHTHSGSAPVEQTIEGDAIFNKEDVAGRLHERGNVHDADKPSYPLVGGTETETSRGRLPNYPDASQGRRWARFEENLRRERPKIVSRCSACDELQNRHKEDAA